MDRDSTTSRGRFLEAIVARMHEAPGVTVERNVRLPSRHGSRRRPREIDVLVTTTAAGYTTQFAIECKNEAHAIGVQRIGAFLDLLDDVGIPAQQGIYVSASNFTSGAIERAKAKGLRLFLLDGLAADRVSSLILDATQCLIFIHASVSAPSGPWAFVDEAGNECGTVYDLVWERWLAGEPPSILGPYQVEVTIPPDWVRVRGGPCYSGAESHHGCACQRRCRPSSRRAARPLPS